MKILVNGQTKELNVASNLHEIVGQFCKDSKHVIAELNGQIVKSQAWSETSLKDGDTLELVNFVGGG